MKIRLPRIANFRWNDEKDKPEVVGPGDDHWYGLLGEEFHLQIDDVLTHETDRGKVIVVACVVEDLLKHIQISDKILDPDDYARRRKIADDLDKQEIHGFAWRINIHSPPTEGSSSIVRDGLRGLKNVRDRCAHDFDHFDLDNLPVKQEKWINGFSLLSFAYMSDPTRKMNPSRRVEFIYDSSVVIARLNVLSHQRRRDAEESSNKNK